MSKDEVLIKVKETPAYSGWGQQYSEAQCSAAMDVYYNQAIDKTIDKAKEYSGYSYQYPGNSEDLIRELIKELQSLKQPVT